MNPQPSQVLRDPILFLAFGFGSGLSPKAPGTLGTLVAVPFLYWALSQLQLWPFVVLTIVISVLGVPICGMASRKLGVHDHGGIVWDEFAGLFVTALPLVMLPQLYIQPMLALALAFAWFRFFDVLKPWPIRWMDKHVHGGLGIMLDDLLAGVFAALALWGSLRLLA